MKTGNNLQISTSPSTQSAKKLRSFASLALQRRSMYGRELRCNAGKELDNETGLYYYGARYLDPKTSRWLSGDPAVGEYIPSAPVNEEAKKRNGSLPGMGGVFNYANLHAYHYAGNNPVKYVDPDGRKLDYAQGSSPKFKLDVFMMKLHLLVRGNYALIRDLDNRPETIYIRQGEKDDFYFDSYGNEIVMDTRSGLKVGDNKIQSPALGFLHEAGHALQSLEAPVQFNNDRDTYDPKYNTAEERRVIESIETPAAQRMGEPTRHDHGGEPVQVESSTYSENIPKIPYL